MSELASLQRAFASGLLGQDDAILGHIQPGRFAPDALLQIYRTNFILGLTEVLASSYPAVRAMVGETFFEAAARGFVLAAPLEEGSVMDYGEGFGDWLALDPTNSMLTNTAYFAYDAMLMEQIASKLGKESDKMRFKNLYEQIKASFNKHFVDNEGYTYAPSTSSIFGKPVESGWGSGPEGDPKRVDTQTSYVVPLQFGLFDEQNKPKAIQHLVDNVRKHGNTLTTGFIGTPYLNLVLSDNGFDDLAYTLFEQTAYPSWLYPVLQGATTIWERWNSYTIINGFGPVDMNSFNHYSYGAIEEWMMAYSVGIQRNENKPGYKDFILQPKFGGSFTHITGFFDSVYGRIESGWNKQGNQIVYKAKVPANTTATLHLQVSDPKMIKAPEGASFIKYEKGEALYSLQSGDYQFVIKINKPVDKL